MNAIQPIRGQESLYKLYDKNYFQPLILPEFLFLKTIQEVEVRHCLHVLRSNLGAPSRRQLFSRQIYM